MIIHLQLWKNLRKLVGRANFGKDVTKFWEILYEIWIYILKNFGENFNKFGEKILGSYKKNFKKFLAKFRKIMGEFWERFEEILGNIVRNLGLHLKILGNFEEHFKKFRGKF